MAGKFEAYRDRAVVNRVMWHVCGATARVAK
jgi:hypothetical protein